MVVLRYIKKKSELYKKIFLALFWLFIWKLITMNESDSHKLAIKMDKNPVFNQLSIAIE